MVKGFVAGPAAGPYWRTSISRGDTMGQIDQEYEQDVVTERKPISALTEMIRPSKATGGETGSENAREGDRRREVRRDQVATTDTR